MPHSKSSEMRTHLAREAVAEISDELLFQSPYLMGRTGILWRLTDARGRT